MTPHAFRAALPRTYDVLLARHGSPNEVQLAAAPALLAGGDVLICSATASGKTEAYMAPLAEMYCRGGAGPARVLVVSPTRALVNDLARRLAEQLGRAGIEVGRWTGDHHDGGRLHEVTVLTPEGLDSRLSRAPASLADVRAVVLDELHVLDGTARGDHLRILVQRLRVERALGAHPIRGDNAFDAMPPLQVVVASATVPDVQGMADRYLAEPVVVAVGDRRRIHARIVHGNDADTVRAALLESLRGGARKVLVFCNSRQQVECLARELRGRPPFGHAVFAHHGSLARSVRLEAERAFRLSPTAVCFATCSLELGIDIGDVDLVALVALPSDVSSFLQRIGRGGRRGAISLVVCFATSRFEESAYRTLLRAQAAGDWFGGPYQFRPGTLVQQAVSILQSRRSRTVDAAALHRRLPTTLATGWPADRLEGVLAVAGESGWIFRCGVRAGANVYRLGDEGEKKWRMAQTHANIPDEADLQVIDALTGDELGRIGRPGKTLALGGRGRRQLIRDGRRVVTETRRDEAPSRFRPRLPAAIPAALATALLEGAGIPVPVRARLGDVEILSHGLGTAGGLLLGEALTRGGLFANSRSRLVRAGRLALTLEGPLSDELWPKGEVVEQSLDAIHDDLSRLLQMGPFHDRLPERERRSAVASLSEADLVRRLLDEGPPPTKPVHEPAMWNGAAGW